MKPSARTKRWCLVALGIAMLLAKVAAAADCDTNCAFLPGQGIGPPGGAGGWMAAGDVTGDGLADLVVLGDVERDSTLIGTLTLLVQGTDGKLTTLPAVEDASTTYGCADVGDLTGDGQADVAACTTDGFAVWKFQGGKLVLDKRYSGGAPAELRVGDFNGDGALDVVVLRDDGTQTNSGELDVYLRATNGGLATLPVSVPVGSLGHGQMAIADVDGDGRTDVVVPGGGHGVWVLLQTSAGTLGTAVFHAYWPADDSMVTLGTTEAAVGDVTGDGRPDLLMGVLGGGTDQPATSLRVLPRLANGGDGTPIVIPTQSFVQALQVRDVNRDGVPDLLAYDGSQLVVNLGATGTSIASGTAFQRYTPLGIQSPAFGLPLVTADLNHDGKLDVVVPGPTLLLGTAADLRVSIVAPESAPANASVPYMVTVKNNGPDATTNVNVTFDVPGVFAAPTGGGACGTGDGSTWVCPVDGALAAGQSVTLTANAFYGDLGDVVAKASATGYAFDPSPANSQARATVSVTSSADLSIMQTLLPIGLHVTDGIDLGNGGPVDAEQVVITIDLPAGETLDSVAFLDAGPLAAPCTTAGTRVTCTIAKLPAGTGLHLGVDGSLPRSGTYRFVATIAAHTADGNPANNRDDRNVEIAEGHIGAVDSSVNTPTDADAPGDAGVGGAADAGDDAGTGAVHDAAADGRRQPAGGGCGCRLSSTPDAASGAATLALALAALLAIRRRRARRARRDPPVPGPTGAG